MIRSVGVANGNAMGAVGDKRDSKMANKCCGAMFDCERDYSQPRLVLRYCHSQAVTSRVWALLYFIIFCTQKDLKGFEKKPMDFYEVYKVKNQMEQILLRQAKFGGRKHRTWSSNHILPHLITVF